jgi:hypothetical protein
MAAKSFDPRRRRALRAGTAAALGGALIATGCGGGPVERWVRLELPFPLAFHASVVLDDGRLLILGGSRGQSTTSFDVHAFEPGARRFVPAGTLQEGRLFATATRLADGRVLVVGGGGTLTGAPEWELFDPARGRSVAGGALAQTRKMHSATRLADGRVLVAGGTNRSTAELYDPVSGRWRLLADTLVHPREGHSATLLADGTVLIAGGQGEAPHFAERFDPRTERFTPLEGPPGEARLLHAAHRGPDGRVTILGGEVNAGQGLLPQATAWRFDPATARFEAAPALAQGRTLAGWVGLPDGSLCAFGGQTPAQAVSADALVWTPGRGERALALLPSPRRWASAHALPDGAFLVLGGTNAQNAPLSDAWIHEEV